MPGSKFPRLIYNRMSILGVIIAIIAAFTITFLYIVDLMAGETNPYFGIFLYMISPMFLILGLLMIPVGMYRHWRIWKKEGKERLPKWPKLDLNDKGQRNATFVFIGATILFVGMSSIGSYQAFHFSESVTFCGKVCHHVMKPEHTAYQNSPHARVTCVSCHVGPGADWYAKSKMDGAYQIYAVMVNNYPTPIPTPIESLRPAQGTCEQCHWPEKFFGGMQKSFDHYMYDEANTHWPINLLIKVGGGDIRSGKASDIHWHVNQNIDVQYIPRDDKRQDIPWVRVVNHLTGDTIIYQNDDDPMTAEEIAEGKLRTMDCVDCHNRPSHIYRSPDFAVDKAINSGLIEPDLPEIKLISVEAMATVYETEEEAFKKIEATMISFYEENYPEIYGDRKSDIEAAIKAVQNEFSQNIFPEMKVRWEAYPDNIGHFNFVGCMRCHEGLHVNEAEEAITHDCNACHTIMAQGAGDRYEVASELNGLEFTHPEDIDEAWREMGCYECHTGTRP